MVKNDFQVLPFYKSIDEQNYRKPYTFGNIYPLIFPTDYFPIFQLEFGYVNEQLYKEVIARAALYTPEGKYIADIKEQIYEGWYYSHREGDSTDWLVFNGLVNGVVFNFKEGFVYLRLEFSTGETYYSEVMCFSSRANECLKIEWNDKTNLVIDDSDNLNIKKLLYSNGYTNIVYIDSAIGKPEYDLDEEGEERDGYFFAEKQISKKTYRFTFLAPEYLCDIARLTSLSDYILITYKGKRYRCDSILLNFDWEDQGDLANVEAEFTCNSIIKKIAAAWPK